jgi:hypothetical protein
MKPIFTVDAGEYLVGEKLERRGLRVWVPSKDAGVDLLVMDRAIRRSVRLQVKMSRDYSDKDSGKIGAEIEASGFFSVWIERLRKDAADFWVFVIVGAKLKKGQFLFIRPGDLFGRLSKLKEKKNRPQHFFLWIAKDGRCWETEGLSRDDLRKIALGKYKNPLRDLTPIVRDWSAIEKMLGKP